MIYFVSDLHLGHRSVLRHTQETGGFRGGASVDEHDEWVIERCLSVGPDKRACWYILGDIAMEPSKLELLNRLPGRKWLVLGNHDKFASELYLKYFERLKGGHKKYNIWITHIPVHPLELRGHLIYTATPTTMSLKTTLVILTVVLSGCPIINLLA